jgi:Cu/Ag efflux protein CusF
MEKDMKYLMAIAALAWPILIWAAPDWTRAVIVKVEPEKARVVLNHQRIKSIGMEAMIMPFKVANGAALARFKPGDKVRFTVIERNDHLVIDAIEADR